MQYGPQIRLPLLSIVALLCVLAASAQSGRRIRKTTPAPAPVSEAMPAPDKPVAAPKPALTLIVGMDRDISYGNVQLTTYEDVLLACADRLNDNPAVEVVVASSEMGRGEAVKRAKAEKEAYVVWLQLRSEIMRSADNNQNLLIEYSVFAPITAKVATSGQTYPQLTRNRGIILNPRTSGIFGDYKLQQAAREAAERILSALHHPVRR
jgi:hypothetical protein